MSHSTQRELLEQKITDEWLAPGRACRYRRNFLCPEEASDILSRLWQELPWQQQAIQIFGRRVMQPRLVCWQSDPGVDYGYSGIRLQPAPWHPLLARLRQRLEGELGLDFNAVLINAYRDGNDSMGWHADDEPELGAEPVLASISLGAERMFRWRAFSPGQSGGMKLHHGSLLVLESGFQRLFQHCVPKTRMPIALRINLTFRRVLAFK